MHNFVKEIIYLLILGKTTSCKHTLSQDDEK